MSDITGSADHAAASARRLSQREVLFWAALAVCANLGLHWLDLTSFAALLYSFPGANPIQWFAICVILWHLWRMPPDRVATERDIAVAGMVLLLVLASSLLAYRGFVGLVATLASVWLFRGARGSVHLRAAATVLLALAVHVVWGPILFRYFMPVILWADAGVAQAIIAIAGPAIENGAGHTFAGAGTHVVALVGACSSFNNVSLAVLGFVSVVMMQRSSWVRADLGWVLVLSMIMIALNGLRILLLARSSQSYQFWHEGAGVEIFGFGQGALILAVSLFAAHRAGRAP